MSSGKSVIRTSESGNDSDSNCLKRVLVIEKNPRIRNSILDGFPEHKFDLWASGDGNLGLAIALAKKPDLILTDLILPKRSGFLVIEYLRRNTVLDCPVVILTSNDGKRHREYAELLGVQKYFVKPVRVPDLIRACTKLLADHESADQVGSGHPTLVA